MMRRPSAFEEYRIQKRKGFRIPKVPGQTGSQTLASIESFVAGFWREHGEGPTTDDYIKAAEPKDSPLHHTLTRDVKVAMLKLHREEARYNMTSYEYRKIELRPDERDIPCPGVITIPPRDLREDHEEGDGGRERFEPGISVLQNDRLVEFYIKELLGAIARLRQQLKNFEHAWKDRSEGYQLILEGIDKVAEDEKKRREQDPPPQLPSTTGEEAGEDSLPEAAS